MFKNLYTDKALILWWNMHVEMYFSLYIIKRYGVCHIVFINLLLYINIDTKSTIVVIRECLKVFLMTYFRNYAKERTCNKLYM